MTWVDDWLNKIDWDDFVRIVFNMSHQGWLRGEKVGYKEASSTEGPRSESGGKDDFVFGDNQWINDILKERTIILSEKTKERLRGNIKKAIMEGVSRKEGITGISKRIQAVFADLQGWEAERIARTEVMTAVNLGRASGWVGAGIKYKMWWNGAIYSARTADDSKRMFGQIQEVGRAFVDPLDGKAYFMPPMRPNDRCTARPVFHLPDQVVWIKGQMYDARYIQVEARKYR